MKLDPILDPTIWQSDMMSEYSYKYHTTMAILKALKIAITVSTKEGEPGVVYINIAIPADLKERVEPVIWELINDPAIRPLTDLVKVNYNVNCEHSFDIRTNPTSGMAEGYCIKCGKTSNETI